MDDVLRNELESSLVRLAKLAPSLDELLFPRQAPSGENAGKAPTKGKSKPPIDVSFLDLKIQTFNLVDGCVCRLHSDFPEMPAPKASRGIVQCADYLLEYLDVFVARPWAERAAEQVIAQALIISDVISPPVKLSDPTPVEVGTVRVIVKWARWLGRDVSRSTVQRWISNGIISAQSRPDGGQLIQLTDVLQAADMQKC